MARRPDKPYTPTKKHLARVEREARQRRAILISSGIVLLLVVLVIIYGVLNETVLKARQPVAEVNSEAITTESFQGQTRYARYSLIQNASQTAQFMQLFGNDPSTASQFIGQLQQIQLQLNPTTIGQQVLDQMIDDKLIRQEAERRGITVTDAEVEEAFQKAFGYFPEGTPTPTSTSEPQATSTLTSLQMTLVPPTPTPTQVLTETQQITGTETLTATQTLTETIPTPSSVLTPTAEAGEVLTPTATLAPSPTPTEYTAELFQKDYEETIQGFQENFGITEADLRHVIESGVYREKVREAVLAEQDIPRVEEQVWARHILVGDEQTAQQLADQLQAAPEAEVGDLFRQLAAEYSTDTSNASRGGDLGWFSRGRMVSEFETIAFSLPVGQISDPVQTQFGWHIIQVLGHEERPLDASQYEQKQETAFTNWLDGVRADADIEQFDYWTERVPTEPTLPPEIVQLIQQAQQQQPVIPTQPSIVVTESP